MEEITKEMNDGICVYRDEQGEEIGTFEETLDWIVRVQLEPLRDFLNMDIDGDSETVLHIAQPLLARAEEKIYEAARYIEEEYGSVEIVRARYHQSIEPETMLNIVFTPCEEVTA